MINKRRFYITCTKILPGFYRKYVEKLLTYGGEKELTVYDWLGSANVLCIMVFIVFMLVPLVISGQKFFVYLGLGIFFSVLVHVFVLILLHIKMEDRTERIEQALPDFLQLTSANIRSGMTAFNALRYSSKKEFGPLKSEIDFVVSKSLASVNFTEIIFGINKRVKSSLLERTLRLFTNAIKTGGHVAVLLEDIARDIIETRGFKRELITNTRAYIMFILFMIIVGSPLLLAISSSFLSNMLELQPSITDVEFSGIPSLVGDIKITLGFMTKVSIILLVVTGFLSSILIGVINEGNYYYGARYSPGIILSSLSLFFILKFLVSGFLG